MSIIFKDVNYIYSPNTAFEIHALCGLNLEIRDGSFTAIIGATGSGKSTLIQHLNGLLLPTSGKVNVRGMDTADKAGRKAIRRTVGMVFQYPEHQLFEETVYKDIAYGPENLGLDAAEVEKRVYRALELVDMEKEIAEASPFDLSGGQMRRVAIAGVLAMNPEILVLDEPTAGLDPLTRKRILQLISDLHRKEGITIVLVTHDMAQAAEMAEDVIVLHHGEAVLKGSPREVFSKVDELNSYGLGVPPINELCRALKDCGWDIPLDIISVKDAEEAILRLWKERMSC